jgi:hypothetical protein
MLKICLRLVAVPNACSSQYLTKSIFLCLILYQKLSRHRKHSTNLVIWQKVFYQLHQWKVFVIMAVYINILPALYIWYVRPFSSSCRYLKWRTLLMLRASSHWAPSHDHSPPARADLLPFLGHLNTHSSILTSRFCSAVSTIPSLLLVVPEHVDSPALAGASAITSSTGLSVSVWWYWEDIIAGLRFSAGNVLSIHQETKKDEVFEIRHERHVNYIARQLASRLGVPALVRGQGNVQ